MGGYLVTFWQMKEHHYNTAVKGNPVVLKFSI